MSWWALLLVVFAVWILWAYALVLGRFVEQERRGVPLDERAGVSLLPVIPCLPMVFWGAAVWLEVFVEPWGTYLVVVFHAALGALFVGSVCRDRWRLHSLRTIRR